MPQCTRIPDGGKDDDDDDDDDDDARAACCVQRSRPLTPILAWPPPQREVPPSLHASTRATVATGARDGDRSSDDDGDAREVAAAPAPEEEEEGEGTTREKGHCEKNIRAERARSETPNAYEW